MNKLTRNTILSVITMMWLLSIGFLFISLNPITITCDVISTFLLILCINDINQKKHSLLRNYPILGRLRWVFEHERTKIQQYFIEHDTNGTPYNKEKRSDVYQKSKNDVNTVAFGTQLNVYQDGYEYLQHSLYPKQVKDVKDLRITIGGPECKKPYNASIVNISAMSYGALSNAAIESLNLGAKNGNFYHNTGEGGISDYHKQGGDLVYQVGTGYFGCGKTVDGVRMFDDTKFIETIKSSNIKMIEIKLSQGAKPGHGGILPAKKNTKEIADIRGVEPGVDVMSPPYHTAFSNDKELLIFIKHLRKLSNGLPIGIKMCVGNFDEVESLINLMSVTYEFPDFITIDGGEGGTGASPLVFTNHIGTPLLTGLNYINKLLIENELRSVIKIIASGKASTSFDVVKFIANGADMVNIARGFMLSLGCIQARECNMNTCPVGIATQNKYLIKGLVPEHKAQRVYNYHKNLTHEIKEVIAAMGLTSTEQLTKEHIKTTK